MSYEKINLILIFLGIIGSFLGFAFTTLYNRTMKAKEDRIADVDKQIQALWARNEERNKELNEIRKQLNTMQGEHNASSNHRRRSDDNSGDISI